MLPVAASARGSPFVDRIESAPRRRSPRSLQIGELSAFRVWPRAQGRPLIQPIVSPPRSRRSSAKHVLLADAFFLVGGFRTSAGAIRHAAAGAWRSFTALASYSPAATAINWSVQARTRRRSFAASGGPGRSGCVWVPASPSPSHFAARNAPENLPTDASGCWRVDRTE